MTKVEFKRKIRESAPDELVDTLLVLRTKLTRLQQSRTAALEGGVNWKLSRGIEKDFYRVADELRVVNDEVRARLKGERT